MRLFGKRRKIQFTDKTHPMMGIVSAGIGVVCLIVTLVLFIGAGKAKGHAPAWYGYIGTLDMLVSLFGFIIGIRCLRQEDIYITTPSIGITLNGILTLGFILLLFVGVL